MGVKLDVRRIMVVSAALRVLLVAYGEWQDAHMEVRYTDVDYLVFSDAAALVATGGSPFGRSTYRYSPLLAFLLVPNSTLHPCWGKLLFSTAGNTMQAAFWYGLVVHFRIYPIIYSLPILLVLNGHTFQCGQGCHLKQWNARIRNTSLQNSSAVMANFRTTCLKFTSDPWFHFRSILTKDRLLFGLISGSVFFFWTALFFYLYGWEFLNEALLYHLTRTDPRHNFSIYFYHIYLRHQHGFSVLEKFFAFLPQLLVQAVLVLCFSQDLPFCFFTQTVAFVAFNKVITAQYFVWFFCLLPLILPWSSMKLKWEGLICILVWVGAQVHWLMWGYLLEFKGKNVFVQLWSASIVFLLANAYILVMVIRHHRFTPLFVSSANGDSNNSKKME